MAKVEYCNWTFWEVIKPSNKWGISRDCDDKPLVQQEGYGPFDFDENVTLILTRGDSRNWRAYSSSLEPHPQFTVPPNATCPGCGKHVNGVNPYDDGETWSK